MDGIKKGKNYRDAAFMGIMRKTLLERLRALLPDIPIRETKGFITKYKREKHAISKSHINDARCISGNPLAKPLEESYLMKPVRSNNRQIHKAVISKGDYRKYAQYWTQGNAFEQSNQKAIKCAEVLIPGQIPYDFIVGACVVSNDAADVLKSKGFDRKIVVNPHVFYR